MAFEGKRMKVIIVGGVAGGASCAARLRRLDENAEIVMVERGPYVSYANCGLPYFTSGIIERESSLLVANVETFRSQFAIDVRTGCEAIDIDPANKIVELRDVETGRVTAEPYDKLVLSPGGVSLRPPLPGIDLPGIFQVRTVPDARAIREWIEKGTLFLSGMHRYSGFQTAKPKARAVVVGGGFIGIEMVENLVHAGFDVTLVEMLDHVLAPLDPENARMIEAHMEAHGVHLALSDGVASFERSMDGTLTVKTRSGKSFPADMVILALGVRPDTVLAKKAGLEIGERGGIRVDDQMRTSHTDILAVGDAIEVKDYVTGEWNLVALAGPANRQGRIAADVIVGRASRFRGSQGTSIIGVFGGAAAWTGVSEKTLKRRGETDYEKVYLYPNSHAGYYPGAKPIALKVVFRKSDGRVLGAQALSLDGPAVDKRISVLAMAIQMEATIYDLEESELCYAPQFGSAKDPVNFAGMVAADVLNGDLPLSHWRSEDRALLLDVREPTELAVENVPDAVNIPLGELRGRLGELPRDRDIHVICRSGQRAYYATRLLLQHDFRARTLSGGMLSRYQTGILEGSMS
ncbi:FAD-dependent oxidoreductase [Rhizobium leguminosarum]|uniref:FAD-dependent oxidoreductase n=2 Tax=Rhizobium leguminosarum TaxID=384 RepID=UPI00102F5DA7|nr:FAD-dependent oxidoreductase [Rhizobium leguminosarum]TAU72129.1 CoA-disulfide reductase [Rhizobium leguminosarum]TAX03230.1 CoA-disulfide reductase [Rhizobium leguminosarum]TAX22471.1 CoA-disulfide reductase [Rhizobium leguminosarum]TAY05205.1 CoA-disulfide reductase [Rhizobium leguminosarum]TAZ13642.1 CoA-disulfide reductase [Rhizobium leguminosarum]